MNLLAPAPGIARSVPQVFLFHPLSCFLRCSFPGAPTPGLPHHHLHDGSRQALHCPPPGTRLKTEADPGPEERAWGRGSSFQAELIHIWAHEGPERDSVHQGGRFIVCSPKLGQKWGWGACALDLLQQQRLLHLGRTGGSILILGGEGITASLDGPQCWVGCRHTCTYEHARNPPPPSVMN